MAPELLLAGRVSKASDVYAFAILLWELFTGGHAYAGMPRALLVRGFLASGLFLPFGSLLFGSAPSLPLDAATALRRCFAASFAANRNATLTPPQKKTGPLHHQAGAAPGVPAGNAL
jgi:hypothetical protein